MGRDNDTQPELLGSRGVDPVVGDRESEPPTGSRRITRQSDPPHRAEERGSWPAPPDPNKKNKVPTQRGLTGSKPPKLVTKHGLAPPPPTSSPPPPPPDDPHWQMEDVIPRDSRVPRFDTQPEAPQSKESWVPDDHALATARNQKTPIDAFLTPDDIEEAKSLLDPVSERARFQTNRGGGRNRMSGGRAAASAYVSPSTLSPGHGVSKTTSAVKVHQSVRAEQNSYQTEPSLLRKRLSTAPLSSAPPEEPHTSRLLLILILSLGAGFLVGAFALFSLGRLPVGESLAGRQETISSSQEASVRTNASAVQEVPPTHRLPQEELEQGMAPDELSPSEHKASSPSVMEVTASATGPLDSPPAREPGSSAQAPRPAAPKSAPKKPTSTASGSGPSGEAVAPASTSKDPDRDELWLE